MSSHECSSKPQSFSAIVKHDLGVKRQARMLSFCSTFFFYLKKRKMRANWLTHTKLFCGTPNPAASSPK